MKRILLSGVCALAVSGAALATSGAALAADLPPPPGPGPKAPSVYLPAPVPFTWTGIYVGLNAGYNFGTVSPTGAPGFNTNGFLIGGTLGGNYQIGSFVLGLEGDGGYNSVNASMPGGGNYTSNWLATVRGRAGYALDRVLLYATGGGAFAPASVPGGNTTMTGWTVGGGLEYAFTPNWTAKAEYLYVDFPNPTIAGTSFTATENVIRAGVNYKFW